MKTIIQVDKNTVKIDNKLFRRVTRIKGVNRDITTPLALIYVKWEYTAMDLAQLVKTARMKKHLTQKDLADKLNMPVYIITRFETTSKIPYKHLLPVLTQLDLVIGIE